MCARCVSNLKYISKNNMQHRLQCTHFPGIVCTNKLNYLNIYDTENTFAASPSDLYSYMCRFMYLHILFQKTRRYAHQTMCMYNLKRTYTNKYIYYTYLTYYIIYHYILYINVVVYVYCICLSKVCCIYALNSSKRNVINLIIQHDIHWLRHSNMSSFFHFKYTLHNL